MKSINIIGGGKLGKTLGKLFNDKNVFKIKDVLCLSKKSAKTAVEFIGNGTPVCILNELSYADIFLISTPDDVIEETANKIAQPFCNSVFVHCSGSLASDILKVDKRCSIHPIHSFANPKKSVEIFTNTMCAAEGNEKAVSIMSLAFEKIGGNIFEIKTENKPLYHASMVIACNYFVVLEYLSSKILQDIGLNDEEIIKILAPILQGTLNNIKENGFFDALTGPIARGDIGVVEKHIRAIKNYDENLLEIYKKLGSVAVEISKANNLKYNENLFRISEILNSVK